MAMARIEVDGLNGMIAEVGGSGTAQRPRRGRGLDAVLAAQFEDTQARIGVKTGALKVTGQVGSKWDAVSQTWEGALSPTAARRTTPP